MMKNFTTRLFIAFTYAILLGLWSCADQLEDLAVENSPEPSSQTKSLDGAVYHESTKSWIVPQKDPYTLANFQKAYDNLASNRSVQRLSRAETAAFTNTQPLEATHYSLRIFPKNEKEQWKIELMEDVKVAYTPFDYVPLPEADAKKLASTRSAVNTYPDKSRFTVTYDDVETTEGPAETVTYTMPVLYAVWPCNKPLPEDMVYEIDYEVFIPNYTDNARSSTFSTSAMQVLEAEAISLALGTPASTGPTTKGPIGQRNGNITSVDRFLNKKVPQVNLKQRFQLGSNIWDVYTDSRGDFFIPKGVPLDASYSHLFMHERWKITWDDSTIPYIETWGRTIREYWGSTSTISTCPTGGVPAYEIHPAVNYYFKGPHAVSTWYYESGIRIEAHTRPGDGVLASFVYSRNSISYIKIYNNHQYKSNTFAGAIFHEFGHFTHYGERGGYRGYTAVHKFLRESYAEYVGWYIGEHYYANLGYTPSPDFDLTGCNAQDWEKTDDRTAYYSPLFVDLRDDYNQGFTSGSTYNDDIIKGVPNFIIKDVIANSTDWNSAKAKLRENAGTFYSLTDINNFFIPYDYWFANN